MEVERNLQLNFSKHDGLVPAIVQHDATGDVLMLGFMNREALDATRRTGVVTFFSRSRGKLWVKGESSGHRLHLRKLLVDCDADTVLVRVTPAGPGVCHEGYRSCFFREVTNDGSVHVTSERTFDPAATYGNDKGERA